MRKLIKPWIVLALITLLGLFLRVYQIDQFPPSLNWDEVSHGYNAYSILKTGADEWGTKMPLIFRAFGDYKLPVYIYLTVIPVWLFGLSAFSVRIVSVLAGTLAIPGIYLLVNELTRGRRSDLMGMISAFLLAVSPWHFFISRPALEANLALTFIIFAGYFMLKSLHNSKFLVVSSFFLFLTVNTYNTYRIFTPLLILGFIGIFRSQLFKKYKLGISHLVATLILVFATAIIGYQVFNHTGTARYGKLSILTDNAVYQIGQMRTNSHLPAVITRLIYNRPVYFASHVGLNYIGYFSPAFFYQTTGVQTQFAIPFKNLLTLPISIFAIIGFVILLTKLKFSNNRFLLFWLLIAPVAAAITADPPQALRPTPMIIPLIILATLGLTWLCHLIADTIHFPKLYPAFLTYFLIVIAVAFGRYVFSYQADYPKTYSSSWQYGYQQVFSYLSEHQSEYDRIFVTKGYGEPHIFYAFFTQLDPKVLQSPTASLRYAKSDWFWTDRINNVYFVNDWQIPKHEPVGSLPLETGGLISTQNSLLITTPDHLPSNALPIKTIDFLNGNLDFVIAKF